jgi:hypothetical protein
MLDLEEIIEAIFTLVVVLLLGYVFVLVFLELSPVLAGIFIIVLALVIIGIIFGMLRRL